MGVCLSHTFYFAPLGTGFPLWQSALFHNPLSPFATASFSRREVLLNRRGMRSPCGMHMPGTSGPLLFSQRTLNKVHTPACLISQPSLQCLSPGIGALPLPTDGLSEVGGREEKRKVLTLLFSPQSYLPLKRFFFVCLFFKMYVYRCFACVYAHVHVYSALGGPRWVSDPLELESQRVLSHHVSRLSTPLFILLSRVQIWQ